MSVHMAVCTAIILNTSFWEESMLLFNFQSFYCFPFIECKNGLKIPTCLFQKAIFKSKQPPKDSQNQTYLFLAVNAIHDTTTTNAQIFNNQGFIFFNNAPKI